MADGWLRLDKFLWFARLTRTRLLAQSLAEGGHLRVDGRAVARAHQPVRVGNILTFPLHGRVRIIRIEALPARRGGGDDARMLYTDLSPQIVDVDAPPDAT